MKKKYIQKYNLGKILYMLFIILSIDLKKNSGKKYIGKLLIDLSEYKFH